MGITPNSNLGKVEFYEAHLTPWTNNAAAIGLSLPEVAALTIATTDARAAYNAMIAARDAAKAATQSFYSKVSVMHSAPGLGSDMIDTIKNFAQTNDDPNVYTLAQIPPPASGGVVPPPGTPFDFRVGLRQDGSLELKWKCNNPTGASGTVYEILRSISGGAMAFVDNAGEKLFVDATLPPNAGPVTYQITGVRTTVRGDPAQFTVQFGTGVIAPEGQGGLSLAA
jgi:hypothetical protein